MKWTPGMKLRAYSSVEILAVILGISTLGQCFNCRINPTCTYIVLVDGGFTGQIQIPTNCSVSNDSFCVFLFDENNPLDNISSTTATTTGQFSVNQPNISNAIKNLLQNWSQQNNGPSVNNVIDFLQKFPDYQSQILNQINTTSNITVLIRELQSKAEEYECIYNKNGLWLLKENGTYQLLISRDNNRPKQEMCFLTGNCTSSWQKWIKENFTTYNPTTTGFNNKDCNITCLNPTEVCNNAKYKTCNASTSNDDFIEFESISAICSKCGSPIQKPEVVINLKNLTIPDITSNTTNKAAVLQNINTFVLQQMGNATTASVSVGDAEGVFVKPKDRTQLDKVTFIYSDNTNLSIIQDLTQIETYPRALLVPKEAFEKAANQSNSTLFTSTFRFPSFTEDEENSIVFNNEVYSIDMGADIENLTNTVSIAFRNINNVKDFTPSCHSWNGSGLRPNWTTDGCNTTISGGNITCQCTHLTFFALLMVPNPQTEISSTDLTNLTYITSIGCGMSIFFLGVALFMHFLLRRARNSDSVRILINLLVALVLLNLTFVTNEYVANTGNIIGCKLMAGFMHYCLLTSFTWFGLEALHLCLQLGRKSSPSQHYFTKICIAGWAPPAVVVTVLFCMQKYNQLVIPTNTGNNSTMCWITDSSVHYVVNIGYYSVVFAFTFTTFVVMLRWIVLLRGTTADSRKPVTSPGKRTGTGTLDVLTVMGLCCTLGLTWGFAFFAYGALRLPSYYIFTILNSFQGFFLFIYYYNTSKFVGDNMTHTESNTNSTEATSVENPYQKPKTY